MKKSLFVLVLAALMVLAIVPAPAVEVPGVSPVDFGGAVLEAGWVWTFLGSSTVAAIVAAIWKIVQSIISRIHDERIARSCSFVYAGTITCYQEYVRVEKEKHADGKLTLDEKNEALQYAYRKAIEIGRTEGLDLLKVFGKDMILALIEKYAGLSKAGAALAAMAGPLSGSQSADPEPHVGMWFSKTF